MNFSCIPSCLNRLYGDSLIGPLALAIILFMLTACAGLDSSTANLAQTTGPVAPPLSTGNETDTTEDAATKADVTETNPTDGNSTLNTSSTASRPRHLPLDTGPASLWETMMARWDSGDSNNQTWPLDITRGDWSPQPTDHFPNTDVNATIQSGSVIDSDAAAGPDETNDLWQRMRKGFQLSGENHRFVKPYIDWYADNQAYLDRVVERARPFLYDIVQEIEARGMPMEIALLPVVESAFQPFAYSSGRAAGIWQFIPATGKRYGLKQNWWYDGRRDVPEATKAALDYLQRLAERFDGDWLLALASYNSGEGRVARAVEKNKKKGRPTDFWSLDLPDETEGYVPKLLAISAIINHNDDHGITLASIPDEPYLESIDIGSQIDLALAAELADLPIETLYRLNPAFNRWATDPKGPHVLSLPIDKADDFRDALAKLDSKQRIRWQRHKVRDGETLGHIARKYQTTVNLLQEVNGIRDKWIRAGDSIIIPVATKNLKEYLSKDRRRVALQSTKRTGYKIKHEVKSGDTFWDLSRKYKVNTSQLASWNGMSPKDTLMPGQQLVVWSKTRSRANTHFVEPPSRATRQQLHYKVRKGDSLARIADKFSVTVEKLRRWNSLKKGKYLQPGQHLTLFVDVTEQS